MEAKIAVYRAAGVIKKELFVAERMPKTVKPSAARIGDTERALTLLWLSAGGPWCLGSMSR